MAAQPLSDVRNRALTSLLAGRTIVVTGAAGGLGRVMILALLQAGASVVAVDRDERGLQTLCEHTTERVSGRCTASDRLRCLTIDLTRADCGDLVVAAACSMPDPFYAVVNNAGIMWLEPTTNGAPCKFWEVSSTTWDLFASVNAAAVFRICRAAAPLLIARGDGRIINVTTSLSTMTSQVGFPYGPTKASAEALSAVMAKDLGGTGVTVNVLIPGGPTDTDMVPVGLFQRRQDLLRPDVMVPPLLWLLSDAAAGMTNRRWLAHQWPSACINELPQATSSQPIAWTTPPEVDVKLPTSNP